MKILSFFISALFIVQINCSVKPEKYSEYIVSKQKKFCKVTARNGIRARVCYVPSDFYRARDITRSTNAGNSTINKYKNNLFFIFTVEYDSISAKKLSPLLSQHGIQGFKQNVITQNFLRQDDFLLVYREDTIKTVTRNFERDWGSGTGDSFLLQFAKTDCKYPFRKYTLIIRNTLPELGNLKVKLSTIVHSSKKLQGT